MNTLDDNYSSYIQTAAGEVKARGAELIIISDKAEWAHHLDPNPIIIPSNGPRTALGAVLPSQCVVVGLWVEYKRIRIIYIIIMVPRLESGRSVDDRSTVCHHHNSQPTAVPV
jgi:hypothetical protein